MWCASASLAARRYGQSLHLPIAALTASLHRRAAPPATARFSSSSSSSSSSSASPAALYDYFPATLPEGAPPRGRFAVDVIRLRREFLRLQAAHHPDKHPPAQRPTAEARSVAINHAFRTLADPLLRAQYLLSLRGLEVAADEHWRPSATSHHGPHTPPSCDARLLHDVMDAYDLLDEAAAPEDLDPLRRANDVRLADCEDALERAFARDDVAAASREAVTLRYWVNIRNALRAWEPGKPLSLQH